MQGHFEGWYYKHQANGKSLAAIPGKASDEAFVWVVTDEGSFHIRYPLSEYKKSAAYVKVGGSVFSPSGVVLDIHHAELTLTGEITYKNITPIRSDIMGPFKYFPMECRHGIISMNHVLNGAVMLNGETLDFSNGKGYIESDSGRSFPSKYVWAHCNAFNVDCSIMASVARIPFYGLKFWGCIAVVWLNGKEYRLATYKGVKILQCKPGVILLKQGEYQLNIIVQHQHGQKLPAPQNGTMSRFIRENLQCAAKFQFFENGRCLFDEENAFASYEYMMED